MISSLDAAKKLQIQVRQALDSFAGAKELKSLIYAQLVHDGRGEVVENDPHLPFFLLPVTVCQSLGGKPEAAYPAAAAMQFFMAAGDILDDIEDNDSENSLCSRYGMAKATNAATALIFLAEKTLAQLRGTIAEGIVNRLIRTVNSQFLKACFGQHLDLSIPHGRHITESAYLKIAGLKSACPIEISCQIGAILAAASRREVALLAKFGYYLGMSGQMNNDIKGLSSFKDIRTGKVTLPFIFALRNAGPADRKNLRDYLSNRSQTDIQPPEIVLILQKCGAIQYTMIKSEYFKQLARGKLEYLNRAGIATRELELLLE